ncbi:hypothetical protein LTR56_011827 [Elasticomyces elasticus]|nr:hypothetical protein LTR56_011827 [Elasticomyces elasticus]KAK3666444.1 hypothetical protein LTR22_002749 [Elasticomyces elasticus]KAK4931264.1 hypothetical protein LTR49_002322 [Elasticomyces elasticus]KAK5767805.1 hypothetical protein LTS12_001957 [Elasticomyces elasticus]
MSAPQASQGGFPTRTIDPTNSTGAQAIANECDMLRRRIHTLEAEVRGIRLAFEGILVRGTRQPTSSRGSISEEEFFKLFVPVGPFSTAGSGPEPGVASGKVVDVSAISSPAPSSSRGSISEEEFFKLFVPFGPSSTAACDTERGMADGEAVDVARRAREQHKGSQAEINGSDGSHGGHPPGTLDHIAMQP